MVQELTRPSPLVRVLPISVTSASSSAIISGWPTARHVAVEVIVATAGIRRLR